jgi:hypothetical protein
MCAGLSLLGQDGGEEFGRKRRRTDRVQHFLKPIRPALAARGRTLEKCEFLKNCFPGLAWGLGYSRLSVLLLEHIRVNPHCAAASISGRF